MADRDGAGEVLALGHARLDNITTNIDNNNNDNSNNNNNNTNNSITNTDTPKALSSSRRAWPRFSPDL